jgi:hypothetical protein
MSIAEAETEAVAGSATGGRRSSDDGRQAAIHADSTILHTRGRSRSTSRTPQTQRRADAQSTGQHGTKWAAGAGREDTNDDSRLRSGAAWQRSPRRQHDAALDGGGSTRMSHANSAQWGTGGGGAGWRGARGSGQTPRQGRQAIQPPTAARDTHGRNATRRAHDGSAVAHAPLGVALRPHCRGITQQLSRRWACS